MDKIGRYHLLRLLGEGAMGRVHLALLRGPAGFEKQFAIKILRETHSEQIKNTIISEGIIGGKLRHPNIVEVFELGEENGRFFLVMEYVDGIPLDQALVATQFSPKACVEMGIQIAQGIRHIHEQDSQKLVHSDIKPSNILISRTGLVKVADLGLIRSSFEAVQTKQGTPGYMAPEQCSDDSIDQRADIFSLGIVLVESLLGRRFFSGITTLQLISQGSHSDLIFEERFQEDLIQINSSLMEVLKKMLQFNPEKRHQSMKEVLEALLRLPELSGKSLLSLLQEEFLIPFSKNKFLDALERTLPQDAIFNQDRILNDIRTGLRESSVLVIKGASGQGKTRTLRILQTIFEHSLFIDGVRFQSLDDLLGAILQNVNTESTGGEAEDELERLFESWDEFLLLIDNVDDLHGDTWRALRRLTRNAKVRIVMTSMQRVSQQDVLVYELPVLSEKMSWSLFKARISERGEVFHKRDQAIWSSVIARADGLPLVVELLAAQYCLDREKILPLDQVWKETALERAFEEAFSRLSKLEQESLKRLASFQTPFSLSIASEILRISISKTNQVIDALHRSSLILHQSVSFSEEPYFKVPGGMRSLLSSKLNADEKKNFEERYANVCAQWFEDERLSSFEDYFSFQLAKIEALPDCLRAMEVADQLQKEELLWQNALVACQIYSMVGPRQKGLELAHEYLNDIPPDSVFGGEGKLWKGILCSQIGDDQQAKIYLGEALAIFEQKEDYERQQCTLCHLIFTASGLKSEDDFVLYQEHFQREPADISTQGLYFQAMGHFYTQKGDGRAIDVLRRAVSIHWSLGDNRRVVASLIALGVMFFRQNRHALAEKNYRKAIEIAERCLLQEGLESAWMNLALISIMSNRIAEALTLFARSRERYQKIGNSAALALLESNWAMLCLLEKDFEGIKLHLKRSEQQSVQNPIILHSFYGVQGLVALEQGKAERAQEYLTKAWDVLKEYGLSFKRSETLSLLGEALLESKQFEVVNQCMAELSKQKGTPLYDFWHALLLSNWCYQQDKVKLGDNHLLHMIRLVQNSEFPERPDLWLHIQRIRNRFHR